MAGRGHGHARGGCGDIFDLVHVDDVPDVDAPMGANDVVGSASAESELSAQFVIDKAIDVSVGDSGVCATLEDHTARCWGENVIGARHRCGPDDKHPVTDDRQHARYGDRHHVGHGRNGLPARCGGPANK